ncbi:MAG: 30S ribosomal protein S16 [Planctomycetia bacterium]|nr:30S ribosomal protein S16 [Planctomycetia bacterium]
MKRIGRKNRAYYRICATDKRSPRDGRVIEVIGTYDPSIPDTDARCALDGARLQHWLSVGAQPSPTVRVLIKKYGPAGTRLKEMEAARAKVALPRVIPDPGPPAFVPEVKTEPAAEPAQAEAEAAVATAEPAAEPAAETPPAPPADAEPAAG